RQRSRGRGARHQPAGVPALLHIASRNPAGTRRHYAQGFPGHDGGRAIPGGRREDENLDYAAVGSRGAGRDPQALRDAKGIRRASQDIDQAVIWFVGWVEEWRVSTTRHDDTHRLLAAQMMGIGIAREERAIPQPILHVTQLSNSAS